MGPGKPTLDDGSPGQVILSSFGVLTSAPKTAVPDNGSIQLSGETVFANYVRLAQHRFKWPFKVFPIANARWLPSPHCVALEDTAVRASAVRAPARFRASVVRLTREQARANEYTAQHREAVCVTGYSHSSFCAPFLEAQARGVVSVSANGGPDAVTYALVPNGVAQITVRYPKQSPRTVTVPVVNNLAVWKNAREPENLQPTVEWRAASGRVIRTIYPL